MSTAGGESSGGAQPPMVPEETEGARVVMSEGGGGGVYPRGGGDGKSGGPVIVHRNVITSMWTILRNQWLWRGVVRKSLLILPSPIILRIPSLLFCRHTGRLRFFARS